MTTPVIVIGVGGYASNLVDLMRDENQAAGRDLWRPVGFLDDEPSRQGRDYYNLPILGPLDSATRFLDCCFINAIGSAKSAPFKPALIKKTGVPLDRFVTLKHPTAYVSPSAVVGAGTAIAQHCVVMSEAVVGLHVKTLPLATISYGANIGDYSTVAGGAVVAAEVRIGKCGYIGANSAIRERIRIGDNVIVGMGAMVTHDVASGATVVGSPARAIDRS